MKKIIILAALFSLGGYNSVCADGVDPEKVHRILVDHCDDEEDMDFLEHIPEMHQSLFQQWIAERAGTFLHWYVCYRRCVLKCASIVSKTKRRFRRV